MEHLDPSFVCGGCGGPLVDQHPAEGEHRRCETEGCGLGEFVRLDGGQVDLGVVRAEVDPEALAAFAEVYVDHTAEQEATE